MSGLVWSCQWFLLVHAKASGLLIAAVGWALTASMALTKSSLVCYWLLVIVVGDCVSMYFGLVEYLSLFQFHLEYHIPWNFDSITFIIFIAMIHRWRYVWNSFWLTRDHGSSAFLRCEIVSAYSSTLEKIEKSSGKDQRCEKKRILSSSALRYETRRRPYRTA